MLMGQSNAGEIGRGAQTRTSRYTFSGQGPCQIRLCVRQGQVNFIENPYLCHQHAGAAQVNRQNGARIDNPR